MHCAMHWCCHSIKSRGQKGFFLQKKSASSPFSCVCVMLLSFSRFPIVRIALFCAIYPFSFWRSHGGHWLACPAGRGINAPGRIDPFPIVMKHGLDVTGPRPDLWIFRHSFPSSLGTKGSSMRQSYEENLLKYD